MISFSRVALTILQLAVLPALAFWVLIKSLPRINRRVAPSRPSRIALLTPCGAGTKSGSARAIRDMIEMLTQETEVDIISLREVRPHPGTLGRVVTRLMGPVLPMEEELRGFIADPAPVLSRVAGHDLLLIEFLWGAIFLLSAPSICCPIVLRDHEVLARRYYMEFRTARGFFENVTAAARLAIVWLISLHVYLYADRIVALTSEDAVWLRRRFPFISSRVVAIPVSFAVELIKPATKPPRARHVLYAANFYHRPNVDGLLWFLTRCAPAIEPGVTLHLIGVDEPLQELHLPEKGISIVRHGHVEDVTDAFEDVQIALAPVVSGGGIRIKNLLFASLGKGIVTTRLGNEGINFRHDREALICDSPEEFASAVNQLVRDPDLADRLGRNARSFVEINFSHEAIRARYMAEVFSTERKPAGDLATRPSHDVGRGEEVS